MWYNVLYLVACTGVLLGEVGAAGTEAVSVTVDRSVDVSALALRLAGATLRVLAVESSSDMQPVGEEWRAVARKLASELLTEGRLATLLAEPALAEVVEKELEGVRCMGAISAAHWRQEWPPHVPLKKLPPERAGRRAA